MCRTLTFALIAIDGATAAAQRPYPVYTEYDLDRTMTVVGRNFTGGAGRLRTASS